MDELRQVEIAEETFEMDESETGTEIDQTDNMSVEGESSKYQEEESIAAIAVQVEHRKDNKIHHSMKMMAKVPHDQIIYKTDLVRIQNQVDQFQPERLYRKIGKNTNFQKLSKLKEIKEITNKQESEEDSLKYKDCIDNKQLAYINAIIEESIYGIEEYEEEYEQRGKPPQFVKVKIKGQDCFAFVDNGASVSCFSTTLVRRLNLKTIRIKPKAHRVANNGCTIVHELATVNLLIEGTPFEIIGSIANWCYDLILGRDFLFKYDYYLGVRTLSLQHTLQKVCTKIYTSTDDAEAVAALIVDPSLYNYPQDDDRLIFYKKHRLDILFPRKAFDLTGIPDEQLKKEYVAVIVNQVQKAKLPKGIQVAEFGLVTFNELGAVIPMWNNNKYAVELKPEHLENLFEIEVYEHGIPITTIQQVMQIPYVQEALQEMNDIEIDFQSVQEEINYMQEEHVEQQYTKDERKKIITEALLKSEHLAGKDKAKQWVDLFVQRIQEFIEVIFLPGDREGRVSTALSIPFKEGADKRVFIPQRSVRQEFVPEAKRILDEAVREGYIAEDTKYFASSPAFFVWKPKRIDPITGQITRAARLVVDYRELNERLEPVRANVPSLPDTLTYLSGKKAFIAMDLRKAYPSIPLDEEAQYTTAFSCFGKNYKCLVAREGVSTLPALFNNLMTQILDKVLFTHCLSYFDDVLCYSSDSEEDCIEKTAEVLKLLHESGLKIDLSKLSFLPDSFKFLGHMVTTKGLEIPDERKRAIEELEFPETKEELLRFLGVCAFISRFITHFSKLAAPLHILAHSDNFEVKEEHVQSFEQLKQLIVNAPVLHHYDDAKELYAFIDTSLEGTGGMLAQLTEDNQFAAIAYASQKFKGSQMSSLPSWTLELVGATYLLTEKWKLYTARSSVTWLTDSMILTRLMLRQNKRNIPLLARYLYKLNTLYALKIGHVKASYLVLADYLSRANRKSDGTWDYEPEKFYSQFVESAAEGQEFSVEQISALVDSSWDTPLDMELDEDIFSYVPTEFLASLEEIELPKVVVEAIEKEATKVLDCTVDELHELLTIDPNLPDESPSNIEIQGKQIFQNIAEELRNDDDYKELYESIGDKEVKDPINPKYIVKSKFIAGYKVLIVVPTDDNPKDSQLFRYGKERLVLPAALVPRVLQYYHDKHGHMGSRVLYHTCKDYFHFKNAKKLCENYVRKCKICQSLQPAPHKAGLYQFNLELIVFGVMSIDLSPMVGTLNGYTQLCVCKCEFSKFIIAFPMRKADQTELARKFENFVIYRGMCPSTIKCDGGNEFQSVFLKMLDKHKIKLNRTQTRNSNANGGVENSIKVVRRRLNAMLAENDMKAEQWDTILPAAVCALNVLWRNSLGASPHQIVFGVRARGAMDRLLHHYLFPKGDEDGMQPSDYQKLLFRGLAKTLTPARHRAYKNWLRNQEYYNKKRKSGDFEVADIVWLYEPSLWVYVLKTNKPKSTIAKTLPNWVGPYVVMEKVGEQEYILASENGEIFSKAVHGRFMRKYIEGQRPKEDLKLWDKKGKNVSSKEIQEECRLALPKDQRLEFEDDIAEAKGEDTARSDTIETIVQEVLGKPYDSDEDSVEDMEVDVDTEEEVQLCEEIVLPKESFSQEIIAEAEEEIICYLLDDFKNIEITEAAGVTAIATDSDRQKEGTTLRHKAPIGNKYLSDYIEPLASMSGNGPNTIWRPMELYNCDGIYQYVRCMIIKAMENGQFKAVGEIYVNAYQMNLAQPYMHLGRSTFKGFEYEKTIDRYKYENGLELVELPGGNRRLELVKRLQVGSSINSIEPFIAYR